MSERYLILSNLQIYAEAGIITDGCVVIRDGKVHAIVSTDQIKAYQPAEIFTFTEKHSLIPGLIDLHIHGANGADVMDANADALSTISQALVKEGVTSYLATTMTADATEIAQALCVVRDFMKNENNPGATILGVHLEGPFLSASKVGAQRADKILLPKMEYIREWQNQSDQVIKLVTLAPELVGSIEFIKYLKQHNIIASIGHTDATYAQTMEAIHAGCSHVTHLFNAMRGIHQREPGAVTAALLSDSVMAELIVDGIHLHPAIVQLVLNIKSKEKIVLVSDAMRAKCLGDGEYDLGGQAVTVKNAKATLQDGTLAGSILEMNSALRNMLEFTDCNLFDAVKMAAENPAKALGIFSRKGSIHVSKDADLVVLDEKLNVVMTLVNGRICHQQIREETFV